MDRILVNQEFLEVFPSSEVQHLIRQGFMNFWSKHKQFMKIVEDSWKIDFVGNSFNEFHAKIKNVKNALFRWSKAVFGNVFQQIATLEDIIKVKEAQLQIHPSVDIKAELSKVEADLKKYLRLEEDF
ncbi:hypothetical protein H5410_047296 [Solanum commersonii]|uniref:Uncharacterized protein n=1 Tax=Solanum commersonii TaxID=4109 RepID=A0A9J5XI82_SOLCO|nr:hypothetical protein H5410_047296 [Solanum commersonii]